MPSAPKRQCPRCRALVSGRCDCNRKHYDQRRGTAAERGYDHSWQQRRLQFLKDHPLCEQCLAGGLECWKATYDFHAHRINSRAMTDAQRAGMLLDWETHEPIAHALRYDARTRTLERMEAGTIITEHRRCMFESGNGVTCEATVVDHIKPHRGDEELFDDESNYQGLCAMRHAVKTRRGE